ncbi:MAG: hypothetical protein Q8P22_02515 [Chloroflexota bacterium]|nr:hypothetical protein [Chloroflexota bacterium]
MGNAGHWRRFHRLFPLSVAWLLGRSGWQSHEPTLCPPRWVLAWIPETTDGRCAAGANAYTHADSCGDGYAHGYAYPYACAHANTYANAYADSYLCAASTYTDPYAYTNSVSHSLTNPHSWNSLGQL